MRMLNGTKDTFKNPCKECLVRATCTRNDDSMCEEYLNYVFKLLMRGQEKYNENKKRFRNEQF